jgi:hypothetical protein
MGFPTVPVRDSRTENGKVPVWDSRTTGPVQNPVPRSISRGGNRALAVKGVSQ